MGSASPEIARNPTSFMLCLSPHPHPACPMSACVIGGEPTSASLVSVTQSLEDHSLPGLKGGQPAKARLCERSLAKKVRKHFQNDSIL